MPDLTIEELLVRNVSLEKEMDSLRTMLNNVAEQRDGFRAQMEALSIEALRLKEESDTARRQSTGLESQRAQMEREYDALRARWSAELEGKSREFEELQNQMIPPRDLEAMRLKLIEETEAPWRERARASEAELERARASATALKRDADQLKAAHDAADLEHRAQLREVQVKQQVELAEARAKAEVAARERGPSTEPTDLERMRRLQRENTEVKVRQEKLLEEIDDVRNENEALRQARQQLLELQAQAQAETAAGGKLQAAERESLRRRATHLQSELESAQGEHSRLHEGYLRQENEARTRP